jgi:hypothetical protein
MISSSTWSKQIEDALLQLRRQAWYLYEDNYIRRYTHNSGPNDVILIRNRNHGYYHKIYVATKIEFKK